jgi:hypothetical protein
MCGKLGFVMNLSFLEPRVQDFKLKKRKKRESELDPLFFIILNWPLKCAEFG